MAKRKPVDTELIGISQAVGADYAERAMPEPEPVAPEGHGPISASPLDRALTRDTGYVAPAVGTPAPKAELPKSVRWDGYNAWDYTKDFAAQETVFASALIAMREHGMQPDLNWQFPKQDSDEWKQLSEGIDPEQWHVFGNAVSGEHAREIAFRLREEKERRERLMESGVLPFLAGNIINPESLLATMATGGVSWVQKGSRLIRAAKMAGLAATENVAQEAALYSLQDSRDPKDIAYAAAAGIALGGAFGALSKGLPDDYRGKLADAARRDADRIAASQAEDLKMIPPQKSEKTLAEELFASENKLIEHDIERHLDAEDARLTKIAEGPDALAVKLRNDFAETQQRLDRAKQTRDEIANELSGNEGKQIDEEAQRLARADHKNDYAIKRARDAGSADDAVFAHWKQLATETVKARRARAKEHLTDAQKVVDALQLDVDRVNRVRSAETDLEQLRSARKGAKNVDETAELLPEALKGHVKRRLQSARKDLEESLKGQPEVTPAAPPAGPGDKPLEFSKDSGGAASLADTLGVDVSKFDEPLDELAPTTGNRLFGLLRRFGDYASVLRGIKDPNIRSKVGLYVGDPSPEKGLVSRIGASEEATRLRDRHTTLFSQVYETAFVEHLDEVGEGFRFSRRARRAFGQKVVKELRGAETGSKSAKKAAARLSEVFAEIGQDAKNAGVKGFEDFAKDPRYFPRVPDRVKALLSRDTYGEPQLVDAVATAIKKGYDDLGIPIEPDVLRRMADGYYKRIHDLALGIQNDALSGLRLTDADQIAGLMRLSGATEEQIVDVTARLRNALQKNEGEGSARYAKQRTLLDEDYVMNLRNKESGGTDQVSLRDLLFHDDAEQVFETYNRTMSGWTALAKEAGIKSKADHQNLLDNVRREMGSKEGARVAERLDDAFKHIVGQPIYDTKRWTITRRFGRALRDYQFARVMNMVGFAQMPDAAAYLTPHYFSFVSRHLPDVASMFKRMQDGTLEHQLARDLEEWVGGGTDSLHNKLFSSFDDEPDLLLSKAEHGIRVAARITERNPLGVGPSTTLNQRLAEIAISQRFMDTLTGRSNSIALDRWKQLGLDEGALERIKAQAEKHVEYDGGKLRALDFAKWDDHVARDKFVQAIHRESRRLVQEEDFGDTYPFMHNAIGKMLIQFRRFGMVSYVKQLHYAVSNRSWEQGFKLATQMSLGSLSYAAQMYLYSLTKPEEERQEWRDKYLTPTRILFGGFARAGMFSIMPGIMDSAWQLATGTETPLSGTRTTGLGAGLIEGVPAIDFMSRAFETTGALVQSMARTDKQVDQRDLQNALKLLPFSNMIGVKQAFDYITRLAPEGDDDEDTSEANFVGGLTIQKEDK